MATPRGGYWTNRSSDGGDNHNMMEEATSKCTSGTKGKCTAWTRGEAFAIRYDLVNQTLWDATSDVASCLQDLVWGTNYSTCNPNKYKRTKFKIVAHSMGAALVDRIMSLATPKYRYYAPILAAASQPIARGTRVGIRGLELPNADSRRTRHVTGSSIDATPSAHRQGSPCRYADYFTTLMPKQLSFPLLRPWLYPDGAWRSLGDGRRRDHIFARSCVR